MHAVLQCLPQGSTQTATCEIGPEVLPPQRTSRELGLALSSSPESSFLLHAQTLPVFLSVKPMAAPPPKSSPYPRISVTLNTPMRFSHQFNSQKVAITLITSAAHPSAPALGSIMRLWSAEFGDLGKVIWGILVNFRASTYLPCLAGNFLRLLLLRTSFLQGTSASLPPTLAPRKPPAGPGNDSFGAELSAAHWTGCSE